MGNRAGAHFCLASGLRLPSKGGVTIGVIYVISDSLGETAEYVARAAASQFDGGGLDIRRVPYVTDLDHLEEVVNEAAQEQGIIAFTLVLPDLKKKLLELAAARGLEAVDLLGPLMDAITRVTGGRPRLEPGLIRRTDEDYFRKMEAIDFAVKYDNGKDIRGLSHADLVLIGVSRTSKTPVCMYLAHKRLRAANLALVPEVPLPGELLNLPPEKIIGLTIDAGLLYQIRQERLKTLGLPGPAGYATRERIEEELAYARRVMDQLGCPVINVINKAVEETAGKILQIYYRRERNGK
ncbi:putative pyruvate, phosphate dikinase regulatory protein [Moorella thermoacetica]|uniref:pyruvate, water dikinase regulatory protein n=1 Tax=Neomoorella thermoacetica TaxID=1525 RepID=UPI0006A2DB3F|nr:putative pyruvate, phosphate dikinase regulatory protein [Moorella thermoacetica]